jgi:hypothetical protein
VNKPAAVRMPLESRAETALPTPRQVIPDGCNLGVVLRVLAAVNLALLLVALAAAGTPERWVDRFLVLAAPVEPLALLTLILWCLLRRSLPALRPSLQRVLAWGVPAALTLVLLMALEPLRAQAGDLSLRRPRGRGCHPALP